MSALRVFHTGIFTPIDLFLALLAKGLMDADHYAAGVVVGLIWGVSMLFLPLPIPARQGRRS